MSVVQVRSPCDARFNLGGHETARYLCLNEGSGLMRPGKMRRLPGGDLLNFPQEDHTEYQAEGRKWWRVHTQDTMYAWWGGGGGVTS